MKYFDIIIEIIIILSLMLFAVETLPNLDVKIQRLLDLSEIGVVIIFSIEYVIRLIHGRFKYIFSFFGIIDLLSIVPFFIFFIPELAVIKVLRLIRLLRIIKLARYANALKKVGKAVAQVKKELIVYMILNFCILYIIAVAMYYIESSQQPDKFSSILHSLWWAVVTLTTIGYGDVVPVTTLGKLFTGIISIMGIGVITIPTGLIASTLIKSREKVEPTFDPHLDTLKDNGSISVNEIDPELDEPGKITGIEWED
jgi:voltage-gated potassium channel